MTWRNAQARFHCHVANLFLRLHRYEEAADAYERALHHRPDDAHLEFQRAWCLLEVPRRRADGIISFQKLLRQSPSSGGYYLLGCGLQRESRYEEAVEAFREAARHEDFKTADSFYNYAFCLEAVRRYEEALDAYRIAAQLNPLDADAWSNLGGLLADLGRWKDAAPCQERAVRLAPDATRIVHFASTLYELSRLSEAERVLRDAVVTDPRSVEVRDWLAMVLAGQDRYEEAIAVVRGSAESPSAPLSSRIVFASVLSEAGRIDEALQVAKAAVEAAPRDAKAHGALGGVYLKMNAGGSALDAFELAERLCRGPQPLPASDWVRCASGRAVALSILGRHEEAMAAFGEVLRADPEFLQRWPEVALHHHHSSRRGLEPDRAGSGESPSESACGGG